MDQLKEAATGILIFLVFLAFVLLVRAVVEHPEWFRSAPTVIKVECPHHKCEHHP
jgi:hypothetical protein